MSLFTAQRVARGPFLALFAIALICVSCQATETDTKTGTTPGTLKLIPAQTVDEDQKRGYAEYVPESYYSQAAWPCIIA